MSKLIKVEKHNMKTNDSILFLNTTDNHLTWLFLPKYHETLLNGQ